MEDTDSENEFSHTKDHSPSRAIKSTAVVKYTAVQSPAGYARLQCNTDLNLPPSNWSSAIDSYGLKQILTQTPGLSSFRMAHMFPDCVGEVDVISGAECIKKLLKLPYQPNQTISMMVHRIENTILLDDFGIYDYLMKTEWPWLKDFFCDNILKTMSEKERLSVIEKQASGPLQLTSKFLCHSVIENEEVKCLQPPTVTPMLEGPHLPEPEERAKASPNEHLYNRNVLWTFENIEMLIGTDLPIFGGKDRPCVSLKLRDSREPINVLTGIDYWLDNLMCNVPEVLMCYHVDGFVQKYEPMKTEDLPNLAGSRFSPKIIKNVAQNILAFLKANATKAGHTYWLFKGPHDDLVKLYDLTSLCGGLGATENLDNPFTTPVAMLLYRVARNMRLTNRTKHVKQLLERTLMLLSEKRYPQIVASSHYMLADLYLPATTNPAFPDFKAETITEEENEEPFQDMQEQEGNSNEGASDRDKKSNKKDKTKERDSETSDKDKTEERDKSDTSERDSNSNVIASEGDRIIDNDNSANEIDNKPSTSKRDGTTSSREREGNSLSVKGDKDSKSLVMPSRGLSLKDMRKDVQHSYQEKKDSHDKGDLQTEPPARCGKALGHLLKGLLALHHVVITKAQDEERARMKKQIILEEQHPKMANPYEPIKMNYQSLKKESKESRSRRRKRDKKSEKSFDIETPSIDKNAIMIRKDNNIFEKWQEPNRDDNFAWKLHLKTLLYEKICLAYATLAEYSYSMQQYGFSLKYIEMTSKCQKLLANSIIKSNIVYPSCLIGRVGDNYFQMSKNFSGIDKFKMQYEIDHDVDKKLNNEIDKDLIAEVLKTSSEAFDLDIALPSSDLDSMEKSCHYYRRALKITEGDKRKELLRRIASVNNELGVRYMTDGHTSFMNYQEVVDNKGEKSPEATEHLKKFQSLAVKSLKCLEEATEIFTQVNDVPNLALLCCNRARYNKFKAYCDVNNSSFSGERKALFNSAEDLYLKALKLLDHRDRCSAIWDLVSWELSSHTYTKATLLQDSGVPRASEVVEAFRHALKYCDLNSVNKQYVYQFRAGMIHYKLGSLYHKLYRDSQEEGAKRRAKLTGARSNYEEAAMLFASIEESTMFLSVQLEHVAILEYQALHFANLKLKSFQMALQLLRKCYSMIEYIKNRDPEENKEVNKDGDHNDMRSEMNLLNLLQSRLHFILKNIIQYCRSKTNRDYEKMAEFYKNVYMVSLLLKNSTDIVEFATSCCRVFEKINELYKDCELEV